MSIRPPSDIVLDVARAADPQLYKAAAAKLDAANVAAAFDATEAANEFGAVFDQLGVEPAIAPGTDSDPALPVEELIGSLPPVQISFDPATAVTRLKNATVLAGSQTSALPPAAANAFQNFEAMVLSSFVETMLPQNSEATFGSGSAGQIWRSMLAQQIATQLADSGGIGIADRLEAAATRKTLAPDTTS